MVFSGGDMWYALHSYEEDRIKFAFYLMLSNILICFRALRAPNGQSETVNQYWISRATSNLDSNAAKASECLSHILSYFPEVSRMQKYLKKLEALQRSCPTESHAQVKRLLLRNKVVMKICVDVEIGVNLIKGEMKARYPLAKFAYNLHKSIKSEDMQEFRFALSMFPNKIRPEFDSVLHEERKIVTLIKEKIIRQIPLT